METQPVPSDEKTPITILASEARPNYNTGDGGFGQDGSDVIHMKSVTDDVKDKKSMTKSKNGLRVAWNIDRNNSVESRIGGEGYYRSNSSTSKRFETCCEKGVVKGHEGIKKESLKFGQLCRKRQAILVLCVVSHCMSGLSTSLLAPFFPQMAHTKGMSLTLVGLTFSLFPFTNLVMSPIFSCYLTTIGPKFLLVSGMIVGGVCNILYGALDKCPAGYPFIAMCLLVRFMESLGFSAYISANLTIAAKEFSEHAATVMAWIQAASEVGLMIGPAFGGALYDLGGFGTPFYIAGTLIVFNGFFLFFTIPPNTTTTTAATPKKISKTRLCRNLLVQASMITIATGSFGIGFLESTLTNHLAPLSLSTTAIGFIFAICPALFGISSPFYGYLTDVKELQEPLIVFGHLAFGIGFLFVGPILIVPVLKIQLWSVVIGLIFIGGSLGCALIPTMKSLIMGAKESGCEENMDTYAAVSGLNTSMYSLGSFVGPLLGSLLIQRQGYGFAYTLVGGWSVCMCVFCFIVFVYRRYVYRK